MTLAQFQAGDMPWWAETADTTTDLWRLVPGDIAAVVTSPPYLRQRLYDEGENPAELGREPTLEGWAANLVGVFNQVRSKMTPDGSLWLILGDKYAQSGMGPDGTKGGRKGWTGTLPRIGGTRIPGFKAKDLTLAPFALANRLRDDGWYLRLTIVWEKGAAVESPRLDRPSVSHEYVFLLTRARHCRVRDPGEQWWRRSVWKIPHGAGPNARSGHPASFPPELARRCIVAGTRPGDVVFDPFGGRGTTVMAALRERRRAFQFELLQGETDAAIERIGRDVAGFSGTMASASAP